MPNWRYSVILLNNFLSLHFIFPYVDNMELAKWIVFSLQLEYALLILTQYSIEFVWTVKHIIFFLSVVKDCQLSLRLLVLTWANTATLWKQGWTIYLHISFGDCVNSICFKRIKVDTDYDWLVPAREVLYKFSQNVISNKCPSYDY